MRLKLFVLAFLIAPTVAMADPFCVVDNFGRERCNYSTMDLCRQDAAAFGGACVYRPGQAQDNPYDWGGAIARGMEAGRQRRQQDETNRLEAERTQAEIDALRAQKNAIELSAQRDAAEQRRAVKMEECKAASAKAQKMAGSRYADTYQATADSCWAAAQAITW